MLCMLRCSLACIGSAVAIDSLALLWRSDAVSADDQRTDIAVPVNSIPEQQWWLDCCRRPPPLRQPRLHLDVRELDRLNSRSAAVLRK